MFRSASFRVQCAPNVLDIRWAPLFTRKTCCIDPLRGHRSWRKALGLLRHSQTLKLDCNKKGSPQSSSSRMTTLTSQSILHRKTDEDNEQDMERLAIYSATFASSIGSHIYCPDTTSDITSSSSSSSSSTMLDSSIRYQSAQTEDDRKTCENGYVTESVMKMCHGKRKYRLIWFNHFLTHFHVFKTTRHTNTWNSLYIL